MTVSATGKRIGRPPKPIDRKQLFKLLQMYCTKQQVATFFDCSPDHIENEIAGGAQMGLKDYDDLVN